MRTSILKYGGVAASIVLIAFGIGSIVIGANGRSEVRNDIKREAIVGTPDMTPSGIAKEVKAAGLTNVDLPTCSVAGKAVDSGDRAKCFASYMRIHALEATGGQTYSQMPRFLGTDGKPTADETKAAKGPSGKPVDNPARNIWVTETALSTALNTSSFAESVSIFAIVMGIALLLTGIGFLVLTSGLLSGAAVGLRRRHTAPIEGNAVPPREHVAH
jgi:hypothetical protein